MSATIKIEMAVDVAEQFLNEMGYGHGPCLGATLKGDSAADQWVAEYAYEGLLDRSPTTDPPSIVLLINLKTKEVRSVELM